MKSILMSFIFIAFLMSAVFSQVSNYYPLKHLLDDDRSVAFISSGENPEFYLNDSGFYKGKRQQLIKCGNDIFMFLHSTGRLYKVVKENESYNIKRLDSTFCIGYNGGAFAFCYKNGIYNLGGYGIWRVNGQLRVYNEKAKEWDIVKLNKEIPLLGDASLLWYDLVGKKIFIGYYTPKNEAEKTVIKDIEFIDDVMVLDLEKNEWTKVGTLNPYIKTNLPNIRTITHSPWGLLVMFSDKISLLDYKQNKLLSLSESKEEYQSLQRKLFNKNIYFEDSTLFFGNNSEQTLDSIQLHYSDFIPTKQHIFTSNNGISNLTSMVIILISFVGLSLLLFFIRKKYLLSIQRKELLPIENSNNELENSKSDLQNVIIEDLNIPKLFDEKEKQVLELIIEKSLKAQITNTDDLNRVLGLTKKAIEIQKKQRSDVIVSINKKYAFVTKSNDLLIEKKRADFDKRSFEYFIAFEKLELIKKYI